MPCYIKYIVLMQPLKSTAPVIYDERFIFEEILGRGAYGEVYKVRHR